MKIFGSLVSGNCLKVRWLCDHLGLDYDWVEIDPIGGEARQAEMLSRNPAGQVPVVELDDGRFLVESNAILLYLAYGTELVPTDRWQRAQVDRWLFWEQSTHEASVAVCRADLQFRGKKIEELDPKRVQKGRDALELMQATLMERDWIALDEPTVADLSLVAYTRVAPEGGFSLKDLPAVGAWIARVEEHFGIG